MAALPIARVAASTEKQNPIRNAVSTTESLAGIAEVARAQDMDALTALLAGPQISGRIYTLPGVINYDTIATFIDHHLAERERGPRDTGN